MSEDAKAILLLCGRIGPPARGGRGAGSARTARTARTGQVEPAAPGDAAPDVAKPLTLREYGRIVRWLVETSRRPADLHDPAVAELAAVGANLPHERLAALLGRGVQLGFALDRWMQSGLWVICRSDPEYPARVRTHLREQAPPILFGAGDPALLSEGGLAIVGSRNVDDAGQAFARDVAAWCARGGVPVVSGGARGTDQIATSSALEAGGTAACALADSLLRRSVSRDARDALADGRLVLVSPYHPEARFTVGTAMGRNKLIYALADQALVVSADEGRGGTWTGAVEELARKDPRPVFVRTAPGSPAADRSDSPLPPGTTKLIEKGATPFPAWTTDDDPRKLLATAALSQVADSPSPADSGTTASGTVPKPPSQPTLFDYATRSEQQNSAPGEVRETPSEPPPPPPPERTQHAQQTQQSQRTQRTQREGQHHRTPATHESQPALPKHPTTVYEAVLPLILTELEDALSATELAGRLEVSTAQLGKWLTRAVEEQQVRKLTRPTRYIRRGK